MYTIPADVPSHRVERFKTHMNTITRGTPNLFLFAGDQKIEHLNDDFVGTGIHSEAAHPRHLFDIASQSSAGAFATQLGLINRYAKHYPGINYIAKLNSKTNSADCKRWNNESDFFDPVSNQLWTIQDLLDTQKEIPGTICGVGYTIYLGSQHEHSMLTQAAQIIKDAHTYGLVAILWIYPRGRAIKDDTRIDMLAGAAGVANALGADFVKIKPPEHDNTYQNNITAIVQAAGNTKVIFSGGKQIASQDLLSILQEQIDSGSNGAAIGRNIFQHALTDALAISSNISDIIYNH